MEAIFSATPSFDKLIWNNKYDLERFCVENSGIEMVVSFKPMAKTSEKMRLYAFLFGPLLDCAVKAFSDAGWELLDKNQALQLLKIEFAKDVMIHPKTGNEIVFTMELSKMDKARLLKFIQDIILYLEMEFGQETPSSDEYKNLRLHGRAYRSTRNIRE